MSELRGDQDAAESEDDDHDHDPRTPTTPTTTTSSVGLEGSFTIRAEHSAKHAQTLMKALSEKNRKDKCNRLLAMINWIKETYPETADSSNPNHFILQITDQDKADQFLYFHKMKHDFIYQKLDYPVIGAFLSTKKTKADGKLCSPSNYSKYMNALVYGAVQRRVKLSDSFVANIEALVKSYKNEFKKAEQRGEVDKSDSDPITRPLYLLILSWFLESGEISNWLFSLLQWNCIGRSINIDPLGFQNFHMGTDGMKVTYEFTKSDQSGEKVKGKNIYANPFDPKQCVFTGIGIFLSLNQGSFHKTHHFFLRAGKIGSAAGKYCVDLMKLLKKHRAIAEQYCRTDRTGSHGTRKGAGTYSTSGTTFPPPLSSVAHRGDWSQGQVFDIYLQFADPGDQYLGRILAGLDPNSAEFASLPPHFTIPSTNRDVEEALEICFGDLTEKYRFKGQLLFCLASMVHHVEWIHETAAAFPGHPFNLLPILRRPDLIKKLKAAVSTSSSEYLSQATGIPPHVNQLRIIKEVFNTLQAVVLKLDDLLVHIKDSVVAAIESNDIRSGAVTMNTLKEHLSDFGNELSVQILQKLEEQGLLLSAPENQNEQGALVLQYDDDDDVNGEEATNKLPTYFYHVKGSVCTNWDVPLNFSFPQKISRRNGWRAWVVGFPAHQMKGADGRLIAAPIRPVRSIRPRFLPIKKQKEDLKLQWTPIFSMMEEGTGTHLPKNAYAGSCCSESELAKLYDMGTEYLMHRASYIWALPRSRPERWSISNWSKKVTRFQIEKFGTATDVNNLPPPKKSNRSHPFFSRVIPVGRGGDHSRLIVGGGGAANTSTAPLAPVAPTRNTSIFREEIVVSGEDQRRTTNQKRQKHQKVQEVAYLGIQDSRSCNEIAFQVPDSSIPEELYKLLRSRGNPNSPIPTLDIRRLNLQNLQSQGKMLDSFVVTAYFKTLGWQYYQEGVRVVDDTFMKWLNIDSSEKMKTRYKLSDLNSAKILLIPIFKGDVNCGHFSLVVVDWLTSMVVYYGSFAGIDQAACAKVLESLVREGFADRDMVTKKLIAGGLTGMVQQGTDTNDCGAFTCCLAAAHVKAMISIGAFDVQHQAKQHAPPVAKSIKVRLTIDCPTLWGKYARHHIGDALKKRKINMDDQALSTMIVDITAAAAEEETAEGRK
jgi:hypothetical protein